MGEQESAEDRELGERAIPNWRGNLVASIGQGVVASFGVTEMGAGQKHPTI